MEKITDMIGLVSQAMEHAAGGEVLDKLLEIDGILGKAKVPGSRALKREELLKAHNLLAVVIRDYPASNQLMLVEISGKLLNYVMELTEKTKNEGDQKEDVPVNGIFQTKRLVSKAMVLLAGDKQRDKLVQVNAQLGEALKVGGLPEKRKVLSEVNAELSEMLICESNSKVLEMLTPINQSLMANMMEVSKEIQAMDEARRIPIAETEATDEPEQIPKEIQAEGPEEFLLVIDPPQVEGMVVVTEKPGEAAKSEVPTAKSAKVAHVEEGVLGVGLHDAIEPEQNPMKIDLILEHVFGFLSARDLNACRQVSKFWHDRSLPAWRSTATVKLYPGLPGSKVTNFLKFVGHQNYLVSGKPYTNFSLTGRGTTLTFWGVCGSHISILHLSQVTFQSADDFRNVIFHHCPNMKELDLDHIRVATSVNLVEEPNTPVKSKFKENSNLKSFATNVDSSSFGISWMEVLGHFPALQVLTLKGCGNLYLAFQFGPLFQSAAVIRARDPKKLALKELHDFSHSLDNGSNEVQRKFLNFLRDSTLKLENISFRIGICFRAVNIWEVVTAHASTLKKLKLTLGRSCSFFPLSTPHCLSALPNGVYEKLEALELECHSSAPLWVLEFTPNLKKLVFAFQPCNNCLDNLEGPVMPDVLLEHCTELEIRNGELMPEEQFQRLATCLSRVKTLKVSGTHNRQFATICESWPGLADLTILRSHVDECGITGMDNETVERVNKGFEATENTIPLPNITTLKDLRRFSMDHAEFSRTCRMMGRCAAIHGFQQVAQLEVLKLSGYHLNPDELWNPLLEVKFPSWK